MISREICKVVSLKNTTETTPLMDEFWNSKKDYLIIKHFFTYKNKVVSLIVCKRLMKKVKKLNKPFIITELKKYSGKDISSSCPKEIKPLIAAVKKAINKDEIKGGDVCPFSNPIVFGAQTYANQNSEDILKDLTWLFDGLGHQYGEVTRFYIVGIEVELENY